MSRSTKEWIAKTDDARVPPRVVLIERLLAKMIPEPNSGCWLWTGAATKTGYGHMKVGASFEKAHRLSYRLFRGSIPDGMHVCHKCDVPACVNPNHLWLGKPKDNIGDCISKGRSRRGNTYGESNHFSKLTASDVEAIRASPKGYGTGVMLARQYGVRETTISEIRNGKSRRRG